MPRIDLEPLGVRCPMSRFGPMLDCEKYYANPKKLSILELPQPFVEPRSVYIVANEADQSDDDFMDVEPHISTAKGKEKVCDSSSPVKNKPKQQTVASPHSMRTQPRHVVKHSVKDEFDDIRKLINEKFNSVMDAVR
ncbi:hypothetical protein HAX54_038449, partial [Datura stramonium]|nr:hypothetical protein [Datura stramonium]